MGCHFRRLNFRQTGQRPKSSLEKHAEKVEGDETFAGAVSEEVVSECPAHSLTPPTKQNYPGSPLEYESTARTVPTIHAAGDSEGPSGGCDAPLVNTGPTPTFDSTPESTSICPTQEPACDLLSFDAASAAGFGSGSSDSAHNKSSSTSRWSWIARK